MPKYLITGATGYIGTVLVQDLLNNGHQVLGLARSDSSAKKLEEAGAEVVRGDLEDLEALRKGAKESDGVLHLGFIHDFTNYEHSEKVDFNAVKVITDELADTGKPFVYASGLLGLVKPIGEVSYETEIPDVEKLAFGKGRVETEIFVLKEVPKKGVRATVIRLSPTVHGDGDKYFITNLIDVAKQKGVFYYIDEGKNTWSAVHKTDAATLFRLAAEKGVAGSAYHGAQEPGVSIKDIGETIARKFNVTTESISAAKAAQELQFLGIILGLNVTASNEKARTELGWEPKAITLLEDIKKNYI